MARVRITRDVYNQIARTIGSLPAEHGGALGCHEDDDVIRYFRFDETSRNTGATYSPDHEALNEMFRSDWNPRGIRLAGFVHSHPGGFMRPSGGDLKYSRRILAAIEDLPYLFLPIVATEPDTGRFRMAPFMAVRRGDDVACRPVYLEVVEDATAASAREAGHAEPVTTVPAAGVQREQKPDAAGLDEAAHITETFGRVTDAYDLARMARARIVAAGVGGAAAFIEELARCGVGEFVLIDDDLVSESNLATQQVYRRDIGRAKVTVLAERLHDINPSVRVLEVCKRLDDLDDDEMRSLCLDPAGGAPPQVSVLCGLTDNFYAQARVNALALHLGVPSLCAQVWRQGRGAEITFTYPGLTPACHRCILARRYSAFLAEGFVNDVTSHGTPIFATSRLNAAKGFVTLALLHHRTDGRPGASPTRFAGLAARIGDRNLLQIRMDPDLAETIGVGTFERVFAGADKQSLLFDETVWRPQAPLSGENGTARCPDCGGTGDLRDAIGSFQDTRELRGAGG